MTTGFEGYLIGALVVALIAWRLAGRHVNITNHVSPVANAEASSGSSQGDKPARSPIGAIAASVVAVVVAALIFLAVSGHAVAPVARVAQPAIVATVAAPVAIPIEEYQPVALPVVNTAFDFAPILLLVALGVVLGIPLVLLSRHKPTSKLAATPIKIKRISHDIPEGLTADLFTQAARNVQRSSRD